MKKKKTEYYYFLVQGEAGTAVVRAKNGKKALEKFACKKLRMNKKNPYFNEAVISLGKVFNIDHVEILR